MFARKCRIEAKAGSSAGKPTTSGGTILNIMLNLNMFIFVVIFLGLHAQ